VMDCGWSFSFKTQQQGRCGDHGQCLTMSELADYHRDEYDMIDNNATYTKAWDAEMIQ
jgi:hypothetical protein